MAVFCAATTVLYVATGAPPDPVMEWLLGAGPVLMVILWLSKDAQQRRTAVVMDFGFLMTVFWLVAIPWYAFRSRGRSGWKLLPALILLMFPASLTALVLYLLGLS